MTVQLQHIISGIANFITLPALIQLTGVRIVLPFYHAISDRKLAHLKHLYPVISPALFEQHIDYLLKYYKPASYDMLLQEKLPDGNYFILTFDDGLRQFHDIVAPILIRKGIPATCFLNTGFIDNKKIFFRMKVSLLIEQLLSNRNEALNNEVQAACKRYGLVYNHPADLKKITNRHALLLDELTEIDFQEYFNREQAYMTTGQLTKLRTEGFTFGAHSVNHHYFPDLSLEEQLKETLESVRTVKKQFNMTDGLFSFPYTDFAIGKDYFDAIRDEVCLSFGTANLKRDSIATNFQRIPMEIIGREKADELINTQYLLHLIKQIIGKSIIERS